MAMYHFRLKSDKKPNGTKISAVKHVEYIDREGSFAHDEQWKENNKFVGDLITTAETLNALGGLKRNSFVANGEKIISKRPNIKPAVAANHAKRVEDATKEGFRLPTTYSERTMVYPKSRGTDVLLQADEFNGMDYQAAEEYEAVANRRYREIEFALPNELKTVEQYRQIIDAFISQEGNLFWVAFLFLLDAMTKEAEKLEVKDSVQLSSTGAKRLMDSEEYKRQEFVSQYLLAMKNKMLKAVAEVNKWKRVIISQHDAEEQARLEYMSKSERELWQKYFETLGQKKTVGRIFADVTQAR